MRGVDLRIKYFSYVLYTELVTQKSHYYYINSHITLPKRYKKHHKYNSNITAACLLGRGLLAFELGLKLGKLLRGDGLEHGVDPLLDALDLGHVVHEHVLDAVLERRAAAGAAGARACDERKRDDSKDGVSQ